LGIDTLKMTKH